MCFSQEAQRRCSAAALARRASDVGWNTLLCPNFLSDVAEQWRDVLKHK
jgi:hypothetical protein